MTKHPDAALVVDGQVVFTDTADEIEARMAADLAEDEAKDAIVAAVLKWASYPAAVRRAHTMDHLEVLAMRYERVRQHARPT